MVKGRATGRMWRGLMAVAAVAAIVGSACGQDAEPGPGTGSTPGEPAATSPQATTPTGTETSASPTGTGSGSEAVAVGQVDFGFVPSGVSVAQGEAITVTNQSPDTPHTFTVEGTDIDVVNDAGVSQDVTIDLGPGEYPFACRFHGQMRGTLTVTA